MLDVETVLDVLGSSIPSPHFAQVTKHCISKTSRLALFTGLKALTLRVDWDRSLEREEPRIPLLSRKSAHWENKGS